MKTLLCWIPLCLLCACFDTVYEGPDGGRPGGSSTGNGQPGNGQPGGAIPDCSKTSCSYEPVSAYVEGECTCLPNGPSPSSAVYADDAGDLPGGNAGTLDGGAAGAAWVTTLAGSGTPGYANGGPSAAKFLNPTAVAVDAQGDVYVAEQNNLIRKIDPQGNVTAFAGTGAPGYRDGPPGVAQFDDPTGLTIDGDGNLFVADTANARIRKVDPQGNVTTVAGSGVLGDIDGTGTTAQFGGPVGVAVDAQGNLYVADNYSPDSGISSSGSGPSVAAVIAPVGQIRKIDPAGSVTTIAGKTNGDVDGPDATAELSALAGITIDAQGDLYVTEPGDGIDGVTGTRIREISAGGEVTTVVGNGTTGYANGQDGVNGNAEISNPTGIAVDALGNIFFADSGNERIRQIDASGQVTTFAGNGAAGATDGATEPEDFAEFSYVIGGLAIDASGNLYVADEDNNRIRKITR